MIGHAHAARREAIRESLAHLRDCVTGDFSNAFDAQLARVDGWTARIAAIGQVKAGKSSTLSALIGDIGFLPADVNPWTSVVTNMRINVPGDPASGARFDFFDEAAWDRIINGDPRVRRAAEQFLPGFDAEVLRAQTEEMRRCAEARLGASFDKLLGSHHSYDLLSAELLESYVCAGPGVAASEGNENLGRYSAITRVANLYMQSPDYAVPTIVTDTPGVNDPFLVRDEFTCQSLDQSDIFLVMLSAHQALTAVDVALIRMLALHGEKDVVIYINRVDELEDAPNRVSHVVADVRERLAEAVPGRAFPIVFGSAWWAEVALSDRFVDAEVRKVLRGSCVEAFNACHRREVPDDPREKLLVASGIPEIKRALSHAIDNGSGEGFLDRVAAETRAQIGAMRSTLQRQRHELQDRIEVYGSGRIAEFKESLQDEMAGLAEAHSSLSELLDGANAELDAAVNRDWVGLQRMLDKQIAAFIDAQRGLLDRLGSGTASEEEAEVDLLPLRTKLEDSFHAAYERTRDALDRLMGDAMAEAAQVARKATGGGDGTVTLDGLPGETVAVTFATSRKTLSFNLVSKRTWAFWKGRQIDRERTIEGLRRVAAAEVFPATQRMVEAFTEAITGRAMAGKSRLNLLSGVVEQTLNDRIERLREDQRILGADGDGDVKNRVLNRMLSDVEVIEDRLQVVAARADIFDAPDAKAA